MWREGGDVSPPVAPPSIESTEEDEEKMVLAPPGGRFTLKKRLQKRY
jgi:hypothetical protein